MTNVNVARTTFSTYAEKSTGLLSADAFRSALDSIDPARSGRLTSTSFGIAANALGLSPEETEQALRAFDADGDGLVETAAIVAAASGMAGNDALWSFDEFSAFLPNASPPVSVPGLLAQSDELVATPKVLAKAVEADDAEDASAHSVLFAASFSPGPLGSLASLADAGLYGLEQNWSEAGMSAAAAVLGIGMDAGIANVGLRTGLKVLNPVKDAAYYAANDFIRNPLILAGKSADEIVEIAQNFGYKVEIQAQKGTNAIVIKNVGDSVGRTTLKDIDKAIKNGDPIPDLEFSSVKLNFGQNGHSKVDAFGDKVNNTYVEVKTNSDIFDGKGIFKVVNKDTYTSDMQAGVKLFDYELNSVPVAVVDRLGQKVGEWVPTSSPLVTHPRPVMTAAQTNALAINAAERAASGNLMPLNALEQIEFKEIYDTLMAANKLTDGEAIRYAGSFFTRDNEGALAFLRQNYDKIGVGGETFQSLMRTYQSQLTTSGDFKPANWVGAMMLASFGDPSTGGSGTGPVVSAGQPPHVTTGPSVLGALSADPSIATAQKVGTAINDGALNVSDLQTYLNEANQAVDAFMSSKAPVEAIVSHARSAVANAEAALNRATDAMAGLASVASPAEYGAAMTVLAQARQVLTATSLALENAGGAYNAALQAGMSARDAVASTWKPIASNLTTLAGATKTLITDTYQRAMLLTTDAQKLVIAASVEKIASAAHSGSTLAVVAEEFIAANSKAEIVVATGLKALLSNDTLTRILYGEPFAKGLQLLGAGLGLVGVQQGMNNILQAVDTGAPIKVADILGVAGATLGTFAGLIVLGGATLSAPFTIAGGLVVTGADLIIGSVLLDAAKIAASTYNVSIGGETAVPARDLPAAVNEFVPELVPDTSGTTGPDDVTFPDGGDGRIADAFTGIEHTGSGLTEWQASDPVTNEPYGPSVLLPIGEDPDKYYTNGQWNLAGTQTQVYMAALAEGQNVGEAVATAAMVSAPQNAGVLNYLATHRAQIVNGQIPLSAAIANATTPSNPLPIRRPDEAALVATNNARLAQGIPVLDAAGQRDFRTVYTQAVTGGKSDGDARRIAGNLLKPESQDKLDYFKGRAGELATGRPGVTVDTIIADYKPAANSEAAQIKAISQRVNAPDILAYTGEKRTDFLNIYNWLTQNEGKTDKEAADFARTLLLDKNAATLRSLKREDNLARIAGGEKIASVAAEIELDVTTLTVLNDNLNAQIGLAKAAGNDAGVLLLTATQGVVSMGLANARASTASLGIAGAVKELAATTGKSFSQIMKMIGEGDLMAFGAVIEDLGKVYEATIGGNEMSLAGTSLRSTGDAMYALGVQQKNVDLQASGKMMSGLGDFFAGIGGKGATTATGIGGAASFMGSITSGIGLLTGDNALVGAGNTIMSAAGVLGGGSSITNLIRNSKWDQASFQLANFSLTLSGNLVGGSTGRLLTGIGGIAGTMFQTLKAIDNVGNLPTDNLNGTLGALAMTGLIQGLELANIKIPPQILEMAQVGVQALSQSMTDAAMEVAQEALANLVVDLGKELGVDIANTAVTEALADVGTAITVVGVVYKAVMFGFSIADIAQRDDLSDEMKASLATHALAVEVMKVGISSGNWVVIVVAAVINAVSAFIDMAENGLTRYNIGQLLLGDLGAFLLPEREPNAWQGTFSPADDSTHPNDLFALNRFGADKDGVIHHTGGGNDGMGNRDAFIRVTTPFGITEFSMHEMPRGMDANDPKYFSSIDQLKPLLLQIRDTDELVAKAINEADIRNGEAGRSMAHYNATLPGNRFAEKQDLDGLDATAMGDNRYATIADRLGASGSKAGIAYNAWADMLTSKVIDGSGVDIALATSIGKNPSLLDIPPDVIRRIGNTIAPGSLGVVLGQANTTITHFSTARYNPLVQQMMPMDDMQAMDWVIKTYGLNEGNQWIAVPTPAKRPGLSDTVTALSAVPAEGKALVASLNRSGVADHGGKIEILGMTAWNPDYYELRIDGVQNAYAFMGDHFLQISNVDLRPAIAPEVWLMSHDLPAGPATPQTVFGVVQTLGDMQWVDTNAAIDPQVETLAKIMAQQNPQFQFLGATKNWPDHYEIFVPGRGQHAYTLQDVDGQLVFMQDSQTTLAARQAVSAA